MRLITHILIVGLMGGSLALFADEESAQCNTALQKVSGIVALLTADQRGAVNREQTYKTFLAPGKILSSKGYQWAVTKTALDQLGEPLAKPVSNPLAFTKEWGPKIRKALGLRGRERDSDGETPETKFYTVPWRSGDLEKSILKNPGADQADAILRNMEEHFNTGFLEAAATGTSEEQATQNAQKRAEFKKRLTDAGVKEEEFFEMAKAIAEIRGNPIKRAELMDLIQRTLPQYAPVAIKNTMARDLTRDALDGMQSQRFLWETAGSGLAGAMAGTTFGMEHPVIGGTIGVLTPALVRGRNFVKAAALKSLSFFQEQQFRKLWKTKLPPELKAISQQYATQLAQAELEISAGKDIPYTASAEKVVLKPLDVEKMTETEIRDYADNLLDFNLNFTRSITPKVTRINQPEKWTEIGKVVSEVNKKQLTDGVPLKESVGKLIQAPFEKRLKSAAAELQELDLMLGDLDKSQALQLQAVANAEEQMAVLKLKLADSQAPDKGTSDKVFQKQRALGERIRQLKNEGNMLNVLTFSLRNHAKTLQLQRNQLQETERAVLLGSEDAGEPKLSASAIAQLEALQKSTDAIASGKELQFENLKNAAAEADEKAPVVTKKEKKSVKTSTVTQPLIQ